MKKILGTNLTIKSVFLFLLVAITIVSIDTFVNQKGIAQSSTQRLTSIPHTVQPCLDQKAIKQYLEAGVAYNGKEFYLINYIVQIEYPYETIQNFLTVVSHDANGCLVVMPKKSHLQETLTFYVPKNVAISMALQRYETQIQQLGSQQKFEQVLNEGEPAPTEGTDNPVYLNPDEPLSIFPEDYWALQQLGIRLPEIQVIETIEQIN